MPTTDHLFVMRPHRADPPGNAGPCCRSRGCPPERSSVMTDPKSMARRLRADLAARDVTLSHSEALELVAHQYGVRDWNTLAARPPGGPRRPHRRKGPAVPILRIFDRGKAVEFYVDYLGFTPRLGARRCCRPLPALRPGEPRRRPAPPQRAPRRRQSRRRDPDPGHRRRGAPPRATRPGLRLRAPRDPRRGLGAGARRWSTRSTTGSSSTSRSPRSVEPRPSEAAGADRARATTSTAAPSIAFDAFTRRDRRVVAPGLRARRAGPRSRSTPSVGGPVHDAAGRRARRTPGAR